MYYYFRTIEKATLGILDMFNGFQIKQYKFSKTNNNWLSDYYTVPIEIATKDKILREFEQLYKADVIKRYHNVPKMALMIHSLNKNTTKQTNQLNIIKNNIASSDEDGRTILKYVRNPSWWNIGFSLFIITRRMDDTTQIYEQILPIFQPQRSLNIKLIPEIELNTTLEVTIDGNINFEISNDLDPDQVRFILSTININVPIPIFPPIKENKIIERIIQRFGALQDFSDIPVDESNLEEFNLYGERSLTGGASLSDGLFGNWNLVRAAELKTLIFDTYSEETING
jgi:hypothetical protein